MMYPLHVRREEFTSYVAENMKRKEVLCLLFQEQLFIYGAAFVFGLINGMLFLKLFTVIFMKIAGIQGVNSAPITNICNSSSEYNYDCYPSIIDGAMFSICSKFTRYC